MKTELKIDWASHEAAKYACENWHYSKCLPAGKLVKIGVWENEKFIGVVLFARGASPHLLKKYSVTQDQGCELARIALKKHESSVTKIMKLSFMFLKKSNSGIRLVVSFADPSQGHYGGIYQGGNWVYTGISNPATEYFIEQRWQHTRNAYHKKNDKTPVRVKQGKYRYLMPLDKEMRDKIAPLAKPYPKRVKQAMIGDQPEQRRSITDPPAPIRTHRKPNK